MRRSPVMQGERCAKCGDGWLLMKYDPTIDSIAITCQTCGYRWTKPPLDAEPDTDRARRTVGAQP